MDIMSFGFDKAYLEFYESLPRIEHDKKAVKNGIKNLELIIRNIEKSRIIFENTVNANQAITMYMDMGKLGQRLLKPMMMTTYAQKVKLIQNMLDKGLIKPVASADDFAADFAKKMGITSVASSATEEPIFEAFSSYKARMQQNAASEEVNPKILDQKLDRGIAFAERGLLKSSVDELTEVADIAVGYNKAFAGASIYNLGAVYFTKVGDSKAARERFEECVSIFKDNPEAADNGKAFFAAALENLMILSLSYDEYLEWADRLKEIEPSSAILLGQIPNMKHNVEEEGWAWWQCMMAIAGSYYSRTDPANDPGLYGHAASVLDALIQNRRSLRVRNDEMKTALYEYNALLIRILSENMKKEENKGNQLNPDEYLFMLRKGRNIIDEFDEITAGSPDFNKIKQTYDAYISALTL